MVLVRKVIPDKEALGYGSAQPPRVERSRNPYLLYRESPYAIAITHPTIGTLFVYISVM
jgi:hypothetical protein